MKINNVNRKTTGMNPKGANGKIHRQRTNHVKAYVIADLLFLFRLIKHYPLLFPSKNEFLLYIPDVLASNFSTGFSTKLLPWIKSGKMILLETGDDLFEEAKLAKINPGMQLADFVALLAARELKKPVISSTSVITYEAKKLKIPVMNGNEMIGLFGGKTGLQENNSIRVRKNKIISHGEPALFVGNNIKV